MSLKHKTILLGKGFCMGIADVVPGVSGGTMAFILGIYAQLLAAIKSFDRIWLLSLFRGDIKNVMSRPHYFFLIPLLLGIFSALLFFTRVIKLPQLLIDYPEPIYGLFFGLICGSVVVLLEDLQPLSWKLLPEVLLGFILGFLIMNRVPVETPETSWFIFICGAVAICAMILPGISGSFILLMFKKYVYIFNAIGQFDFSILIPFVLGAITGLVIFSRLLHFLLNKYFKPVVMFITGILIASLWVIWPFQDRIYETVRDQSRLMDTVPYVPMDINPYVLFAIGMMCMGFLTVYAINKIAFRNSTGAGI